MEDSIFYSESTHLNPQKKVVNELLIKYSLLGMSVEENSAIQFITIEPDGLIH